MIDVKKEIRLAFSENKIAFITAFVILFSSMILGYVFEMELQSYLNPVVDDLSNKVQSGVIRLTFPIIFLNNFRIISSMFALGILFCFSAIILSFNGFFTGYYIASADNLFITLLLIVPHGIFEFSSCIIACMSGFVLFHFMVLFFYKLFAKKDSNIKQRIVTSFDLSFPKLKQAVILFVVALILMIIAGIVEVYLTVPFAKLVLSFFS